MESELIAGGSPSPGSKIPAKYPLRQQTLPVQNLIREGNFPAAPEKKEEGDEDENQDELNDAAESSEADENHYEENQSPLDNLISDLYDKFEENELSVDQVQTILG